MRKMYRRSFLTKNTHLTNPQAYEQEKASLIQQFAPVAARGREATEKNAVLAPEAETIRARIAAINSQKTELAVSESLLTA